MDIWNSRSLKAPTTYAYKSKPGEIDITHLRGIICDGLRFYNDQQLLKLETMLLARVIYRMKTKFRNSKDFRSLEKVKKDLMIFQKIDIVKKLEHLLSVISEVHDLDMFVPTKNMVDFILVHFQGIGKILCRIIEMCKSTAKLYECRFRLGHFWRIALIAVAIVSRVHVLVLNIVKFTCLLYIRLLPYSNKLKNPGPDWLPEDYTLPKCLKEWLNIEWSSIESIEIPDEDFNISLINLADDSDDDIEVCEEYIELDEDDDEEVEIISGFPKLNQHNINPQNFNKSVTVLRGFASKHLDIGEVISEDDSS